MKKRTIIEVVVIILLVALGIAGLQTSGKSDAHYTLDHGRISYRGGVVKHKFSGQGHLTLKNHDQYVGGFKNGQFSGKGTFTSHEHWQYRGQFSAGLPDGRGVLTTANHHKYHGQFKKGELLHAN